MTDSSSNPSDDNGKNMVFCVARILRNDSEFKEVILRQHKLMDVDVNHLSEALKRNVFVKFLDLSQNTLTDASALFLSEMLLANKSITKLDISENPSITEEGIRAFELAVQHNGSLLDLCYDQNQIHEISEAVTAKINYWITLNHYPPELKVVIPALEVNSSSVTTIDLSGEYGGSLLFNEISTKALMDAVKGSTQVKTLRLDNNFRGDPLVKVIATAMEDQKSVLRLGLQNDRIGPEGASAIARMLSKNNVLTEVDLTYNEVGNTGVAEVYSVLVEHNTSCRKLLLCDNNVDASLLLDIENILCLNAQGADIKSAILAARKNDPKQKAIVLRGSVEDLDSDMFRPRCNNLSAVLLSDALRYNTIACRLDLADNDIGPDGAIRIADMLRTNQTLTVLSLARNHIRDEGARALLQIFEVNDSIVFLDVSGNDISPKMDYALGNALTLNRQPVFLKKLLPVLRSNVEVSPELSFRFLSVDAMTSTRVAEDEEENLRITLLDDFSIELLCKAIKYNQHVKSLNLDGQNISDVGVETLAEMLKYNISVTSVSLVDNPRITNDAVRSLLSALRVNDTLREVIVPSHGIHSKITEEWYRELAKAVELNHQPMGLKHVIPKVLADESSMAKLDMNALSEGYTQTEIQDTGAQILMDAMYYNTSITSLNLSHQSIGNVGALSIAQYFQKTSVGVIWFLDLSYNMINAEGGAAIANSLKKNEVLKTLSLANNCIQDEGALAFDALLVQNSTIRNLSVDHNYISKALLKSIKNRIALNNQPTEVKKAFLSALSNDRKVRSIDCSRLVGVNYIGVIPADKPSLVIDDKVMESVVFSLSNNTYVQTLDLSNGNITAAGCALFAELLAANTKYLKRVKLCQNNISDEGVLPVVEAILQHNHTIVEFDVSGNWFVTNETQRLLEFTLKLNETEQPLELKRACYQIFKGDFSLRTVMLSFDRSSPTTARDVHGDKVCTDVSCEILAYFMMNFENAVQTVNLCSNRVTNVGCVYLASLMRQSSKITEASDDTEPSARTFRGTVILQRRASVFQRQKKPIAQLQHLKLNGNQVGNVGLRILLEGFRDSTSMQSLSVLDNGVTDMALIAELESYSKRARKRSQSITQLNRAEDIARQMDFDQLKQLDDDILADALGRKVGWL